LDNQYHNFVHAVDVCHTTYRFIAVPELNLVLSQLEYFAVLVAGLAHDVGHLGVNNAFLVKTRSEMHVLYPFIIYDCVQFRHALALRHNDQSPLENMHCVVLYEILNQPGCDILVNLTPIQWRDCRKIILTSILGTLSVPLIPSSTRSALIL
jgi:hypothetical protein